jgi:integrase
MNRDTIRPTMGRRRATTNHGMEPRVYQRRGAYYYVHRETGKWEPLGRDLAEANARARLYNDPAGEFGTMVYWLDMFLVDCEARVKAGAMAQRTHDDYKQAITGTPANEKRKTAAKPGALRAFFAPPITPTDVDPEMVQTFLDDNAALGRPTQANREKAALSSCLGWLIRKGKVPGLKINPCLRASGIKRNPESKRERYVTHEDYRAVYAVAHPSVQLMMEITYRTLQRPESDIIGWTTAVLATDAGKRLFRFKQSKTGQSMRVEIPPALDAMVRASIGSVPKLHQPLVRTRDGHAYTYDGLSAMLKRSIRKASDARTKTGGEPIQSFGFRDLKGKGATDMWRAGVPIEQIQHLCGHADKRTTEIYVKQRWHEAAQPNQVAM